MPRVNRWPTELSLVNFFFKPTCNAVYQRHSEEWGKEGGCVSQESKSKKKAHVLWLLSLLICGTLNCVHSSSVLQWRCSVDNQAAILFGCCFGPQIDCSSCVFTGKHWSIDSHLKIFRKLSGSSLETSVNYCTSWVSSTSVRLDPVNCWVPQILYVSWRC